MKQLAEEIYDVWLESHPEPMVAIEHILEKRLRYVLTEAESALSDFSTERNDKVNMLCQMLRDVLYDTM